MIVIAAAAFAVEIPFFFFGTPSGHDVEFHLYSWLEVLSTVAAWNLLSAMGRVGALRIR